MSTEGWPEEWTSRVTTCLILGIFVLMCQSIASFSGQIKAGFKVITKAAGGIAGTVEAGQQTPLVPEESALEKSERLFDEKQAYTLAGIFRAFHVIALFVGVAIYLCAGEEFVLRSDHWLSKVNGFTAIIIIYVLVNIMDVGVAFVKKNRTSWSRGLAGTIVFGQWFIIGVAMSFIIHDYKKEHTNGAYGYEVFAWVFAFFYKTCVLGLHYLGNLPGMTDL